MPQQVHMSFKSGSDAFGYHCAAAAPAAAREHAALLPRDSEDLAAVCKILAAENMVYLNPDPRFQLRCPRIGVQDQLTCCEVVSIRTDTACSVSAPFHPAFQVCLGKLLASSTLPCMLLETGQVRISHLQPHRISTDTVSYPPSAVV